MEINFTFVPLFCFSLFLTLCPFSAEGNRRSEDQLYEDLLYFYNKNVRPVKNSTQILEVKFGASLIRIIDVDEVNQVLTTSLWLEMQWFDYKLVWNPAKFNGIKKLYIPSDQIWTPDILLYNNADGEPHISIVSDAIVYYTGLVVWKPPSIYKSFCAIEIEYFPFDTQECMMKFGGWTYNGFLMNISQIPPRPEDVIENRHYPDGREYKYLALGMDLSAYHASLEWDLMSVTSRRHEQLYPGCCGQDKYIDITFALGLRRKTLFYAVNLVTPCMLIAILTVFVFYIPACEHKMTYSISVLVTLTVFYLILIELIPPTSMVIPLIGRYLLFTMFLVSFSIAISVVTLNFHRRDGTLHTMPRWIYRVFIRFLPKLLLMTPPVDDDAQSDNDESTSISDIQPPYGNANSDNNFGCYAHPYRSSGPFLAHSCRSRRSIPAAGVRLSQTAQVKGMSAEVLRRMADNVYFVAEYFRAKQQRDKVSENWSYVAMVLDRLLLIVFSTSLFIGTLLILSSSPPAKSEWGEPLSTMPPTKPLSGDTFEFELRETMMLSMNNG
ncbi:hypothetical protein niasHT_025785 [Heterodera trifolii]|uniref:Uncharacterized protein n=1 Tax=Heterodera trifolii TaxID=157864 RepID=A0ABD2KR42_9BILA